MLGMFYGCRNLISLDLSNFNTSSVTNMEYMFYNCKNLISLDLSNFNTSSVTSMRDMFYGCNSTLIYCIYNSTLNQNLGNKINEYNFKNNNNCSDICFNKNKKIIFDDKICALNCTDDDKYNYNNICYKTYSNGTYHIFNNKCLKYNYIDDILLYYYK